MHARFFAGKPEGKIPLERYRRRWGDHIEVDLRYIEWWYGLDSSGSG
jgi:hypothetical protein